MNERERATYDPARHLRWLNAVLDAKTTDATVPVLTDRLLALADAELAGQREQLARKIEETVEDALREHRLWVNYRDFLCIECDEHFAVLSGYRDHVAAAVRAGVLDDQDGGA